SWYPRLRRARGTVWLTICIDPPPTSFLYFTSARSGSIPVVSQSSMKLMVPVGAITLAWAFRQPLASPSSLPRRHCSAAARTTASVPGLFARISSLAAACLRITRWWACALRAYPSYGPTTPASSAERRYAVAVISEVMAAASARPSSESYGRPQAISSAPRLEYPMPSWRYARVVSAIFSVGKSAKQMEMSIAVMTNSTALTNISASNVPSSRRNFIRFSDARLQEELSSDMYSEHGLDAVIRPVSGLVCQSLMVSSYWMPGSAHSQAACAILRKSAAASTVSTTDPSSRARRSNVPPLSTARMNSSETRTELLAFWYWTLTMSLPPRSMSNPASRRARIFSSSRALVSMNSSMSGWSTSSTTIFAARRVAPPDLMVRAEGSAPRMKRPGPEAVPPEGSSSLEERIRERLTPAPEPPLKIRPSSLYQSRMDSIESSTERMKQALTCCGDGVPTLNQTGELKLKYWCSSR